MNDFIVDAIFSFGEAMNLAKNPKNEEEYHQFATPYPDKKITKTWEEVVSKSNELQADYDSQKYQRDRALQYPSIQDQLDMQYHDSVNGTTTWKDAVAKVKSEIPKPT
tara:strand:- start:79 stop:402 length:324 start_codon:yes stop_codon:yes gene_type:complete